MALYDRCGPLFDAFADAEEAVRAMRASLSGHLRISATPAFGRALLAPAVGEFAAMHPDLSFELTLTARRVDLVEEGIDLAVREGPLPDGEHRVLRPRIVIDDLFSLRRLVLDGRGIAPLRDYLVERDLREQQLARLLPDLRLAPIPVTALYPERRFQPTRVKALLAFLRERFRSASPEHRPPTSRRV